MDSLSHRLHAMIFFGCVARIVGSLHVVLALGMSLAIPALVCGVFFDWAWLTFPWLRVGHAMVMSVVALESLLEKECPLTLLERKFLRLSKIGNSESILLHRLIAKMGLADTGSSRAKVAYSICWLACVSLLIWVPPNFGW